MTRWFPSKVDWWLALVLLLTPAVSLVAALSVPESERIIGLASVAFIAAIYLGLLFPMRYGIGDEHLIVRFGLVRKRIPLATIRHVRPTRNPLSSPALSLDRLRIEHDGGAVMISPARRREFLAELEAAARLRRDGDALVR